ncbi:MAG TPA: dihydrodipicolinate reductase [Prolixibacteraceae bacterium]|nr:dihydrodipicolinate reductase [Prolixibacteraceae bacterium]
MKIGLVGFGKTGKAVASVILQNNEFSLEWVLRQKTILEHRSVSEFLGIETENPGLIYSTAKISAGELLDQHPVDAIIDFSSSSGIHTYGEAASIRKVKIISAVSHYEQEELDLLDKLSKNTTVFWSPNITIGVNYLLIASKFLKKIAPEVDIEVIEEHFKQKEGISGTAMRIAEELDIKISDINSIRAGGIVGRHQVIFGFPYQTVRLIHESISREAFGNGVIFVAQNLADKNEGLYNFEELLLPYFSN